MNFGHWFWIGVAVWLTFVFGWWFIPVLAAFSIAGVAYIVGMAVAMGFIFIAVGWVWKKLRGR